MYFLFNKTDILDDSATFCQMSDVKRNFIQDVKYEYEIPTSTFPQNVGRNVI
jgi:hypothetical protein